MQPQLPLPSEAVSGRDLPSRRGAHAPNLRVVSSMPVPRSISAPIYPKNPWDRGRVEFLGTKPLRRLACLFPFYESNANSRRQPSHNQIEIYRNIIIEYYRITFYYYEIRSRYVRLQWLRLPNPASTMRSPWTGRNKYPHELSARPRSMKLSGGKPCPTTATPPLDEDGGSFDVVPVLLDIHL